MKNFSKICVLGLGYIGLPTAAVFASRKVHVHGVDVNEEAVNCINKGSVHIVEPELDIVVHAAVTEGFLVASTVPKPSDAFLIAVPTPFKPSCHEPDLSYIKSAIESIAPCLETGNLVVLESTSPVGTTEIVSEWLSEMRPDLVFPSNSQSKVDVNIAYCPERVLPGHVLKELVQNDRIIGGMTSACSEAAESLYRIFVDSDCHITSARTAEMAKLTENSYRDVNIAFANELSLICDSLSIDVWELIRLANRHPRVNILNPGPGVGGHCIAVDPWFIVSKSPDLANLIRTARQVNDLKPEWVVNKIKLALADILQNTPGRTASDVKVGFLGLTFKPDIDDLRESPALDICRSFSDSHPGCIVVSEPNIEILPSGFGSNVELVETEMLIEESDIIVLLVDHREYKSTSFTFRQNQKIIDTRGLWNS